MATYVVGCFEDHFTTQRAYGLLQSMISVQKCPLHIVDHIPLCNCWHHNKTTLRALNTVLSSLKNVSLTKHWRRPEIDKMIYWSLPHHPGYETPTYQHSAVLQIQYQTKIPDY